MSSFGGLSGDVSSQRNRNGLERLLLLYVFMLNLGQKDGPGMQARSLRIGIGVALLPVLGYMMGMHT